MLFLNQTYKTNLNYEQIRNWVVKKSNEETWLFNMKRYRTRITETGFRIRKKRFNEYQSFYPLVTGEFLTEENKNLIDLKIRPSIFGTGFFGIFWTIAPILTMTIDKATVNGQLRYLNLTDRINGIGLILLIMTPLTLISFIWPYYKTKKWIKRELNLEKTKKMAATNKRYNK
jgi:hypothetical protein